MSPSESLQQNDEFNKYLGYSLVFHIIIAALLVLKAVIYPTEPLRLERAIRVDIVGLPEKMQALPQGEPMAAPEPPKPGPAKAEEAKPKQAPMPPKPETVVLNKKNDPKTNLKRNKQAQDSALKRLEALSRIEKMVAEDKTKTRGSSDGKGTLVKGNEISPGSSLTGLAKIDHDAYLDAIDDQVKKHWNLPEWLANANLKARVLVFIDENGNVIKKQLSQSSRNQMYDERVLDAVDRASPFPPPPGKLRAIFAVDGLELGFPE